MSYVRKVTHTHEFDIPTEELLLLRRLAWRLRLLRVRLSGSEVALPLSLLLLNLQLSDCKLEKTNVSLFNRYHD